MDIIRGIFFDFDNTLVDYMKSDIEAIKEVKELSGILVEDDEFIDKSVEILLEFYKKLESGEETESNIHKYRLRNTLIQFGVEWEEEYASVYLDNYLNNCNCFDGCKELLEILKGRIKLGILTNSYNIDEQRQRIEGTGLSVYFDDVVISNEIKMFKPQKEAFFYLSDKYGLNPEECIYIGDSEQYDIFGAKNAGFHAIRIAHNGNIVNKSKADFVCYSFEELKDILLSNYKFV